MSTFSRQKKKRKTTTKKWIFDATKKYSNNIILYVIREHLLGYYKKNIASLPWRTIFRKKKFIEVYQLNGWILFNGILSAKPVKFVILFFL